MKKLILICLVFSSLCMSCDALSKGSNINHSIDSTEYYKAKCDTLAFLASQYEKFLIDYENEHIVLKDSITKLNKRPVMTEAQFIQLYKYDRLLKYYKICKKKPSQWKYYKGWSARVFEQ